MEFRFVRCKRSNFFGTTEYWADKEQKLVVSDVERTIVDGLKQPEYCGGFTEVAKGLWIKRDDVSLSRLVDYALRLHVGAVSRRLGYLLEAYRMGPVEELERLRRHLTTTYNLLDPLLPREGRFLARWRLRLNVGEGEIEAAVST
jgi:predicted transcriptional regulator of viral defense system